MARLTKRRRQSRRSSRLEFAAIEVVGGLLPTDVIAQVAAGDSSEQTEESYGIPKGLKLRDEIARYYQIGHAHCRSGPHLKFHQTQILGIVCLLQKLSCDDRVLVHRLEL